MTSSAAYRELVALLATYLSDVSIEATLGTVLAKMDLSAAELGPEDLPRVVAEAMVGLRLFCNPERLPELMVDLAELCERRAAAGEGVVDSPADRAC